MSASRRSGRPGERGNALAVVAIGATALIGATGLAIDGGMAAGAYRHAQNAADAGALAAVRTEFNDATLVPPVQTSASSLGGVAQNEVQHNKAQFGSINSSSTNSTIWGPSTTGGMSAQAALAEASTTITGNPPPNPLSIDVDAFGAKSWGWIKSAPSDPPSDGSKASALATLVQGNSQILNQSGYGAATCNQATASYMANQNTVGAQTPCPPGTLPAQISYAGSLVATPNADAEVNAANAPSSKPTITVVNPSVSPGGNGASVSAAAVTSSSTVGWVAPPASATGNVNPPSPSTTASVTMTNMTAGITGVTATASSLTMSVTLSMDTGTSRPKFTPICQPATITVTAPPLPSTTLQQQSDCKTTTVTPIPGIDVTVDSFSPANDVTRICSQSGTTWSCSVQTCMVRIYQALTSTTVCVGELILSFGITPMNAVLTPFAGIVTVTANVPQPTYFMRVLGWNQTDPSASGTAAVENVVDESPSAFAASAFGMPSAGTCMAGTGCLHVYETLQPGHEYYIYGLNMTSYNPTMWMGSAWQGQLDGSSKHHVGSQVTPSSSTTPAPKPFPGTPYYLEPVFEPGSGIVLYYAVFLPDSLHPNWGTLVNSIPADNGPIVDADGAGMWTMLTPGAVTIKVIQ